MKDLCLIVVLYGISLSKSRTLISITELLSKGGYEGVKLIIWNNGPRAIEIHEIIDFQSAIGSDIAFKYIEDINNISLGKIYNKIIMDNKSNNYWIFDHDSVITKDYFDHVYAYRKDRADLLVPLIEWAGSIHGPVYNGKVLSKATRLVLNGNSDFFAITSGMVISAGLINRFLINFTSVFDERYALYGVDTSFYSRLKVLAKKQPVNVMCAHKIHHSLSRLEREDEATTIFRGKERALDLGITLRNYFEFKWLVVLVKNVVARIRGRSKFSIFWFFYALIVGRHPRSGDKSQEIKKI